MLHRSHRPQADAVVVSFKASRSISRSSPRALSSHPRPIGPGPPPVPHRPADAGLGATHPHHTTRHAMRHRPRRDPMQIVRIPAKLAKPTASGDGPTGILNTTKSRGHTGSLLTDAGVCFLSYSENFRECAHREEACREPAPPAPPPAPNPAIATPRGAAQSTANPERHAANPEHRTPQRTQIKIPTPSRPPKRDSRNLQKKRPPKDPKAPGGLPSPPSPLR